MISQLRLIFSEPGWLGVNIVSTTHWTATNSVFGILPSCVGWPELHWPEYCVGGGHRDRGESHICISIPRCQIAIGLGLIMYGVELRFFPELAGGE